MCHFLSVFVYSLSYSCSCQAVQAFTNETLCVGGREERREEGRKGGREGGREGGRKGGRKGGREGNSTVHQSSCTERASEVMYPPGREG